MSTTEIESFPVEFVELPPSLDSFPTHDVSHVGAHVQSISTVIQLLQSLADEDWKSRGQGRYSKAHVLLISWVDDDLGVLRELQDLETVFTNSFNYDVETWGIPRDKSQRRLQERVTQFVNNYEGNDSLLILYYAGHAIRANGGPVWTARQNPDSKISAESIPVQALLAECDSDALLLYDCCFATPIPASGNTCGVTEAIAACGFHETAPGIGQDSFTNALVNELGILSYSPTPISVGELYRRLVQRLRSDTLNITFDENGDIILGLDGKPIFEGDRRRTPIYYPISNEQKRRKILLAPLPLKESGSTTPVTSLEVTGETSLQTGSSKDDEEVNKCSNSNNVSNSKNTQLYPMILLSIRVNSGNLETQTWREWIRDVPTEATNITIQGIYRSCSTLLLLTMPIETWTLLPDNTAYSFVGFVTSPNLAPILLGAAKSTTQTKEQSAITSPEDVLKKSSQFTTLDYPASSKRNWEKLDEEALQERLLKLRQSRQTTSDEEGPSVLRAMGDLALTKRDLGKLEEAEKLQKRVLELRQRTGDEKGPNVLRAMEDLALTKRDRGKLEEAEKLQERVLELRQRTGDEEGSNVLRAMEDLALTKRDRGKLEEAEKLQERVLELRQRTGDEERSNIFENISIDESSSQAIISTTGDLISTKSVAVGTRSAQILGEISDDSIQQVLQGRIHVAGSKAAGPQTGGTQFVDRYGAGFKLNRQSLNDADATA